MAGIFEAPDEQTRIRRLLAHLDTAQRVAGLGSWENDLQRSRLLWSPAVHAIFGWPTDTTPSFETFLAAVHPDDRDTFLDAHEAALAGSQPYRIDHRIVLPNGAVRHVREEAEIERDAAGTAVRLIGVVQDRTHRVRTQRRLARLDAARRELLHRLLDTIDHEHSRLASDLHDGPIQQLTIASLQLEQLALTSNHGLPVDDLVADLHALVHDLRDKLVELEPLATSAIGLRLALKHLARSILDDLPIDVDATIAEPPAPVTRVLLRVAQEALTNVREHADASSVRITATGDATRTRMQIQDDGRGFDVDAQCPDVQRLGVLGMQERAEAAAGTLRIASGPSGTTITIDLPHR